MENKSQLDSRLRFFTSAEVADILKMNPQVIARKLFSAEISGYKIGKDWRVSETQLIEFLEKHSNKKRDTRSKTVDTFFENGRLKSIPSARNKRTLILKHLVSQLDPKKVYSEDEINKFISAFHSDVCTLRREFIMNKLMVRKSGKYKVVTWNK